MLIAALSNFQPILLYIAVLTGFVVTNLILAHVIGPWKRTPVKQMPYESGMDPVGDARQPFDVKFYVVAILFLVGANAVAVFEVDAQVFQRLALQLGTHTLRNGVSGDFGQPAFFERTQGKPPHLRHHIGAKQMRASVENVYGLPGDHPMLW